MTTTFLLIAVTVLVSITAFRQADLMSKCMFDPYLIRHRNEYWRFITHGFIHADYQHLIFNMLTLYFFGRNIEGAFQYMFNNEWVYPFFYISALVVASLPDFFQHSKGYYFRSLGASGAISAVLFATILFDPWQILLLNFFIPVPAILFAVGYIWYSSKMSKQGRDNIGHRAHLYGALYGIVFPLLLKQGLLSYFLDRLMHPRF